MYVCYTELGVKFYRDLAAYTESQPLKAMVPLWIDLDLKSLTDKIRSKTT